MKLCRVLFACALTIAPLLTSVSHAIPIEFTYTSSVTSSSIAGVSAGDAVTITLLADNGGSGLASQSWSIGNIISGSLSAGSYFQSYVDGWYSAAAFVPFATDSLGTLISANFYGTNYSANHVDSFGTGSPIYLYNGAFQAHTGGLAYQANSLSNLPNWSIAAAAQVPEPATTALFGLGALALGFLRQRAKA